MGKKLSFLSQFTLIIVTNKVQCISLKWLVDEAINSSAPFSIINSLLMCLLINKLQLRKYEPAQTFDCFIVCRLFLLVTSIFVWEVFPSHTHHKRVKKTESGVFMPKTQLSHLILICSFTVTTTILLILQEWLHFSWWGLCLLETFPLRCYRLTVGNTTPVASLCNTTLLHKFDYKREGGKVRKAIHECFPSADCLLTCRHKACFNFIFMCCLETQKHSRI